MTLVATCCSALIPVSAGGDTFSLLRFSPLSIRCINNNNNNSMLFESGDLIANDQPSRVYEEHDTLVFTMLKPRSRGRALPLQRIIDTNFPVFE